MSQLCHARSWWLWTTFYPLFLIHKSCGIALLLHLDVGSMSQEIQYKAKQHAHVREVFSSLSGVSAHEVRVHADNFLLRPCPFHSQASVSSPLIIKPQSQDTTVLGGRPQGKSAGSQTLPPAFLSVQLQRPPGDGPTNCALSFKVQDKSVELFI